MNMKEYCYKKYEEYQDKIKQTECFIEKNGHSDVTNFLMPLYMRDAELYLILYRIW